MKIMREPGEFERHGNPPLVDHVWDGRFEVELTQTWIDITPLAGRLQRLSGDEFRALKPVPPPARQAAPAAIFTEGKVVCPILAKEGPAKAIALVRPRFLAAFGRMRDERALRGAEEAVRDVARGPR
ncbi:MAG: hypothetical protein ACRED8_13695, partial [Caulobacteraceae bacterium]